MPGTKTKKAALPFPANIKLGGELKHVAIAPDGSRVLLNTHDARDQLTVLVAGNRIQGVARLDHDSGLFPPPARGTEAECLSGLALAQHDGRIVALACWRDDYGEGPGWGAFEVDGKKISVTYLLDEARRSERAKTGSAGVVSSSDLSPQELLLSPSGSHVAVRLNGEVRVWTLADFVAGGPGKTAKLQVDGFAFDAEGKRAGGRSGRSIALVHAETGEMSTIALDPSELEVGPKLFGGGGAFVFGSGRVRGEDGKILGSLPAEVQGGAAIGSALIAAGQNGELWRVDARSGTPAATVAVDKLGPVVGGLADQLVIVGTTGKKALTLPWP